MGNAKQLIAEMNKNIKNYLGSIVYWTVFEKNDISYEKAEETVINLGLNPKNLLAPSEKKAFNRATKKVAKAFSTRENKKFARRVANRMTVDVVAIVDEDIDSTGETLDYNQTTTARLDKESKTVSVSGKHASEIQEQYDKYAKNITATEVRGFILNSIQENGAIPLRQTGGVYFVPKASSEVLVKLENFLNEFGMGDLYCMKMSSGAENKVVWEAAKEDIEERITKISLRAEKIASRPCALRNQTEKLEQTNEMLGCYSELCGFASDAESLAENITKICDNIAQRVIELEEDRTVAEKAKEKAKQEAKAAKRAAKLAKKQAAE